MVSMEERPVRIVLVGAGNLATHLGCALQDAGHHIVQVFSRTIESAQWLGERLNAPATTRLEDVAIDADAYIIAVKDSALAQVVETLGKGGAEGVLMHTAGSMPMSVFQGHAAHYGVLYPMQTFSKGKEVDFSDIPVFVEASDALADAVIQRLARSVSGSVYQVSSAQRRYIHLSAVFACNFVNHCYALSADILAEHGVPFSVMLPLIDETARKVHLMEPRKAQTGPAVRYDENVMGRHLDLLKEHADMAELYQLMSKSIHQHQRND